jgi:deoxyribonuclease V
VNPGARHEEGARYKALQHDWDVSTEEAYAVQQRLAPLVSTSNGVSKRPGLAAGLAVASPGHRGSLAAAAVLLSLPDLRVIQIHVVSGKTEFPYLPGLKAFREAPLLLEALGLLSSRPDFVIVNGHGLAHPRRFGLACHLGVRTSLPTIGIASTALVGSFDPPGLEKGSWTPLEDGAEMIGAVLRTKEATRPIHASIGHQIDLPSVVKWTLACCVDDRLPEPLREALRAARRSNRGTGVLSSDGE